MDATPGEGEQAKGGERQEVARALHPSGTPGVPPWRVSLLRLPPMDGRLARYPLSREISRRCCPCVAPCRAQLMLPSVAIKDAGAEYLRKRMHNYYFLQRNQYLQEVKILYIYGLLSTSSVLY